jgi:hypothetical protein
MMFSTVAISIVAIMETGLYVISSLRSPKHIGTSDASKPRTDRDAILCTNPVQEVAKFHSGQRDSHG